MLSGAGRARGSEKAGAVLGRNYPGTYWYRSPALFQRIAVAEAASGQENKQVNRRGIPRAKA